MIVYTKNMTLEVDAKLLQATFLAIISCFKPNYNVIKKPH